MAQLRPWRPVRLLRRVQRSATGRVMNAGAATAQLVGFKRHLRAEVRTGQGAYLFSEHGVTVLKGAHIEALAALLDGTRNLETLLGAVPQGMAPGQVVPLLTRLA